MSYNRNMRRDDFDIEPIEKFHERDGKRSRTSGSRTRSRSRKRSYNHHSRSRSRSIERRRHHRRGRDSRSRSRSRSGGRNYSRRNDRHRYISSRSRHSRSRSYSRSRSRSQTYSSRHKSERNRHRDNDYDEKYRRSSRSRSRSRSSSHFRDFGTNDAINRQNQQSSKEQTKNASSSSKMACIQEESQNSRNTCENLEDLPLPQQNSNDDDDSHGIYRFGEDEPIDRERIHKEMEEKLRAKLAKEGKIYPPPKPEASHPVFANDGSFLEIFKKMQQAQASTSTAAATTSVAIQKPILPATVPAILATANPTTAPFLAAAATGKSAPPPPIVGRRRGGKILKTGVVAKPKVQTDTSADPKDFWSLYLAEVNKYKNTACESEQGNRPLVK